MKDWSFHNPVRVHFGVDSLDTIGRLLHGRSYALVTYAGDIFRGFAQRIAAQAGPALVTIDAIEPNPTLAMLQTVCAQMEALPTKPDVLVALGGGSVMDSAKVLATGHGRWQPVVEALNNPAADVPRAMPIIAIPTTSGTGSEVTCWATVWDPENDRKLSLSRDDLYPEAVVVDPRLVAGLPRSVTIASGLDALSHALESLWNKNASPITRSLAVQAAKEIMRGLARLNGDLHDLDARTLMALGSLRAGLAFSNTRTALAHNISYPITLRQGIAHGIACSFCLPDVMTAAIGAEPSCDSALEDLFGDLRSAPQTLRIFLDGLGVSSDSRDYGMDPAQWRDVVAEAFDGVRGRNFIGAIERFPFRDVVDVPGSQAVGASL
ncbi:iron-containing alcohol dehydrogenase PsrA [Luteibacter sp. dw_328]|uniref:iron-containing alcohol dehydrogenase PsrA n=1 Tax=Luteibacter sp. dw_328 TaxID=2719796 RepID=UPI001BD31F81|nr:iron-containing alcohol dehydrogenase PsrA [Luteibacter sp. dw_328]